MASFKRIDGDLTIENTLLPDGVTYTGNIYINTGNLAIVTNDGGTGNVDIAGNLNVGGNVTYINVEELNIRDPFILLNSSNTGTYASNSGILTHKTSNTFAGLRYNNISEEWEISIATDQGGEAGTWTRIASGSPVYGAAGSNTQLQFNNAGAFGASANLTFNFATNGLTLQGHEVLGNIGTGPTAVANATVIYRGSIGTGTTGIYTKDFSRDQELISKNKAVAYSLIF